MSLKLQICAALKTDLYTQPLVDDQGVILLGETVIGDTPLRYYTYQAEAMVTDDGENSIQPDGVSGAGRYIKMINVYPPKKRQETYSGTTNSSGIYAVTFAQEYSVAPNIQVNIIGGTNKYSKTVTVTTTGFSIHIESRTDTLGLLPSYSNVNGASVDILITEK